LLHLFDSSWKCACGKHAVPPSLIRVSGGVAHEVPAIARQLGLSSKCVVVEDANTRKVAGTTIVDDLKREGYVVSELLAEKPDIDNVIRVEDRLEPGDFVIGVGGTSILDIAKLAAHQKGARYILLSTGLANSGIVSRTASIYVKSRKESIQVRLADAILVDLDIVSHAPDWMFAAGCGDLVIEVTAIKDWELGRDEDNEPFCSTISDFEVSTLDQVLNNADEIRSRSSKGIAALVDALVVSGLGMAMWGSSRPSSGSEHLWSHWLEQYAEQHGLPQGRHGEQVGMGTLLMAKYHEHYNPNWWNEDKYPKYQADYLMTFLETVGAPTSLDKLGVAKNLAIEAFVGAWEYRPERYTILHKRHPNNLYAQKVIEEIGV
jgi:glycerol-1-phosphate dehydrogenase [NAD(P)+]